MSLAKSGEIKHICQPNALMTLAEYAMDYGDASFQDKAFSLIDAKIASMGGKHEDLTRRNINRIRAGERDLFI